MATVNGFTAEHTQEMFDATVIGGHLDAEGNLILETRGGDEIPAGNIAVSFDLIYPIGSIHLSVNNVNPGTIFGGTWVDFGAGRMPIGVNSGDARFDAAEETGGTDTLTAGMLPAHTHALGGSTDNESAHTHGITGSTGAESADHSHGVNINSGTVSADHVHSMAGSKTFYFAGAAAPATTESTAFARGAATGRAFNDAIIDSGNTGGISANHYHNVSGNTGGRSAGHTHTLPSATDAGAAHAHTLPANTGNNTSAGDKLLPPYISVYMWKRTA